MMQKIIGAQRDFSSGEVDVSLKRADEHPARKAGLRQMANVRILNSGALQDRPGRSALYPAQLTSRIEEITMPGGSIFRIEFGAGGGSGILGVRDANGVSLFRTSVSHSGTVFPWTLLNVNQIVYAQLGLGVYFTFPGMKPQVLTWDGVSTWSVDDYKELVIGNQKRTFFYRISPHDITIVPSAVSGNVTINASQPIFTAAHVGTRIRYINRQILITNVPGPYPSLTCGATVQETLPGHQTITSSVDPTTVFSIGDVVRGSATGSVGQVFTMVGNPTNSITIQLLNTNSTPSTSLNPFRDPNAIGGTLAFTSSDQIVGPGGSIPATSPGTIDVPAPTTEWDEEVMNSLRGYPQSVFADQFRLGFCDFPALPRGIGWTAINNPIDAYPGSDPASAILEVVPDNTRVLYVMAGAESSEFVFCDKKLYYIKIDASNPLKPGSVGFQMLSGDGCAQVQPRLAQEVLIYVNAGRNSIRAIEAIGAYYRPFEVKNISEFAAHLFNNVQAIATPSADGTFNERYMYVLNGNNQIVVGKYATEQGQVKGLVGWGPWPTTSSCLWVSAHDANVLFTSSYFGLSTIAEYLDDSKYLDASLFVNNLPAPFLAPPGQGPLWWAAGQSLFLMDQGTRPMGIYQIDANGFIVPQGSGGENLALASLVAGVNWVSTVEPFVADASPGQSVHQRMFKRRVSRFAAYVIQSSGFMMARLFSGPITPTSPVLGTVMNFKRFPTWNTGEDQTLPPPLRETAERTRPIGRAFDPRVAVIKDVPGPLQIVELGLEATI